MFKELFGKIGEEVGAAIGVALASVVAYAVSIVKDFIKNKKDKKREKFEVEFKKDKYIGEVLIEVRNDFGADDICLFQVEEEKLKGGVTLEILKMTHEKNKAYFTPWITDAQRILINDYPQTEERLKISPFVLIQDSEHNSEEENNLLRLIFEQQISGVILVLIPSDKKKALGALWLSYIKEIHKPSESDLISLKKHVKQLSYLLAHYE